MKRSEVFAEYTVENGIIRDNGMFESEAAVIVHFHDAYLNGFSDDESADGTLWFKVAESDREEWREELENVYGVSLTVSDSGFWSLDTYETEEKYLAAFADCDASEEESEEESEDND